LAVGDRLAWQRRISRATETYGGGGASPHSRVRGTELINIDGR